MSSGASQIIKNYVFNKTAKTVTFNDFVSISLSGVKLITNVTAGTIIYQFNSATLNGTVLGNVLTLTYNTTAMSNSDTLMIVYEEPSVVSLESSVLEQIKQINAKDYALLATEDSLAQLRQLIEDRIPAQGIKSTGSSLPIAIASDQKPIQNLTASQALSALGVSHLRSDVAGFGSIGININGTFSATITFEASYDGVRYFAISGQIPNATGIASSATGAGNWYFDLTAYNFVRFRVSTWVSGTVNITSVLGLASRISQLPTGSQQIGSVAGTVTIGCISFTPQVNISTNLKNEDTASADADPLFPMGAVRRDTLVANANVSASGDYLQPQLNNFGAAWNQPFFQSRVDTFTVAANGTIVDVHFGALKYFSIQVVGTGGTATTWTIYLDASNDGIVFSPIITHTQADLDGTIKFSAASPCLYFRSRLAAGVVLGGATNLVVTILGSAD